MELPHVRPRVNSPTFDFDLEEAPLKDLRRGDHTKNGSPLDYVKQAGRVWLAVAALVIFVFFFVSSSYLSSSRSVSLPTPSAETSPQTDPREAASATLHAHAPKGLQTHEIEELHAHAEDDEGEGDEQESEEEEVDIHEESEFEYEHHLDDHDHKHDEGLALSHEELFEDPKQHPDEPEYVDIWDGVTHEDLHLSRGITGLRTPLYRLPFVDGQHNDSHVIGVHVKKVFMPRILTVKGGKRLPQLSGQYNMLMITDGRPKPHLNHGRLLWQKEGPESSLFLYYDHHHHTWVFHEGLDLSVSQPLAFLAHGAILPVQKKNDRTFRKYGVPKSVHWILRRSPKDGGPMPDSTIKVEVAEKHSTGEFLQPMLLQKVYHAPEDGSLDDSEEMDLFEDEYETMDDSETEDEEEAGTVHGEDVLAPEEHHLPYGARTYQQFLTHLRTSVYHTFEMLHPRYDHEKIIENPVSFVENNPHPDVIGPERLDGYDHDPHPHPLRQAPNHEDEGI